MNIKVVKSINEISSDDWAPLAPSQFPFASYSFLEALEVSGSVGPHTGWEPCYLTLRSGDSAAGELLGALILYSKTNSYGEYIFDFAWAQAYASYGMNYYPKLLSAIPFTPATGPKLLVNPSAVDPMEVRKTLIEAAIRYPVPFVEAAHPQKVPGTFSSLHCNFITKDERQSFEDAGLMIRHSFQYHWENDSYHSFADFLAKLKSKRRKEILRERNQVAKSGIEIRRLTGDQLTSEHAELMHGFYVNTVNKMGGFPYLTQKFFLRVFETMKDSILLVVAVDSVTGPVAGAINFIGSDTLFGRHWGSIDDYKFLHFELCYYQAIEFAIERNLKLFEAGAQGEHKFQRGFAPQLTYSAHRINEPRMSEAIARFIEEEKLGLAQLLKEYDAHSPFAK